MIKDTKRTIDSNDPEEVSKAFEEWAESAQEVIKLMGSDSTHALLILDAGDTVSVLAVGSTDEIGKSLHRLIARDENILKAITRAAIKEDLSHKLDTILKDPKSAKELKDTLAYHNCDDCAESGTCNIEEDIREMKAKESKTTKVTLPSGHQSVGEGGSA